MPSPWCIAEAWDVLPEDLLFDDHPWPIAIVSIAVKCHRVKLRDFIDGPKLNEQVLAECRRLGKPWPTLSRKARLSLWRRQLRKLPAE